MVNGEKAAGWETPLGRFCALYKPLNGILVRRERSEVRTERREEKSESGPI